MRRIAITLLALAGITMQMGVLLPDARADYLKGTVTEKGRRDPVGLNRGDLDQKTDAFSDDQTDEPQLLDVPAGAYQMDVPKAPKGFNLNATEKAALPTQPMQPVAAPVNPYQGDPEPMPMLPNQPPSAVANQQMVDPDSTPEMLLAWDAWHRRVAEAIYTRFNFLAKLGFKRSPPLLCRVAYVVTRDGQIQNIQIQEKSPNVLFNVIIFQTVKSLNGDMALLQFPQGSRRMFVQKSGVFTQNYGGDGFKYTTGDRETIPGQR